MCTYTRPCTLASTRALLSVKGSVDQTSDGYTRDPMIPSPPRSGSAHLATCGDVCEHVWWTTPDLNPTQWTPEPYTLWLRFVLDGLWCVVCCVEYVVCCVEYNYGVWCMCYGPCRRVGLVKQHRVHSIQSESRSLYILIQAVLISLS